MLLAIAIILAIAWILGFGIFHVASAAIHVLIALAVAAPPVEDQRSASLLPTTVRLSPIWIESGLPSTVMVVLPLWYQPNEPVENSRLSAMISAPPMVILTGSALSRNCVFEIGQGDLAIRAPYHAAPPADAIDKPPPAAQNARPTP